MKRKTKHMLQTNSARVKQYAIIIIESSSLKAPNIVSRNETPVRFIEPNPPALMSSSEWIYYEPKWTWITCAFHWWTKIVMGNIWKFAGSNYISKIWKSLLNEVVISISLSQFHNIYFAPWFQFWRAKKRSSNHIF